MLEQQYLAAITGWSLREVEAMSRAQRRATLIFRGEWHRAQQRQQNR